MRRPVVRFGLAGLANWLVEVSTFNLLLLSGMLESSPAKFVAAVIATASSYLSLKYWAFKGSSSGNPTEQVFGFLVVNVFAAALMSVFTWAVLGVLGTNSLLVVNVVANGAAVFLAMIFRFMCYRKWIFTDQIDSEYSFLLAETQADIAESNRA
jgi:putative flippase GtrA